MTIRSNSPLLVFVIVTCSQIGLASEPSILTMGTQQHVDAAQEYPFLVKPDGTLGPRIAGKVDSRAALATLRKAYPARFCVEWLSEEKGAYAFYVDRHEPLSSALESLVRQSDEAVSWAVLNGLVVLRFGSKGDVGATAMDRDVSLPGSYETFDEARMALERAYNDRYGDTPLVTELGCPSMPESGALPTAFGPIAGTVREVLAALIETTQWENLIYGAAFRTDKVRGLRSLAIYLVQHGCDDQFASEEERDAWKARVAAERARRERYFDENAAKGEGGG